MQVIIRILIAVNCLAGIVNFVDILTGERVSEMHSSFVGLIINVLTIYVLVMR